MGFDLLSTQLSWRAENEKPSFPYAPCFFCQVRDGPVRTSLVTAEAVAGAKKISEGHSLCPRGRLLAFSTRGLVKAPISGGPNLGAIMRGLKILPPAGVRRPWQSAGRSRQTFLFELLIRTRKK